MEIKKKKCKLTSVQVYYGFDCKIWDQKNGKPVLKFVIKNWKLNQCKQTSVQVYYGFECKIWDLKNGKSVLKFVMKNWKLKICKQTRDTIYIKDLNKKFGTRRTAKTEGHHCYGVVLRV